MTFIKYSFSGVISYLVYLILLVISIEIANFEKLTSSIITYGIAVIFNFFLLKLWVFKLKENYKIQFIKYNIVGVMGYLLNSFGFYLLAIKYDFNYLLSQFFLFFVVSFSNYVLNVIWTFKTKKLNQKNL